MKDRIKAVREKHGLSLSKFAQELKTSVATISRYESGERIPSDAILNLICEKFAISYAWLKTGEGPMEDPAPSEESLSKLTDTYRSLPDRLRTLVDALCKMDPEWYKTLDSVLDEVERRQKERGAE